MKTKHLIYSTLIAILFFAACKKDSFLDRVPLSDPSPQTFFKNEADLQLYCNQYYTHLPVQFFTSTNGFPNSTGDKALDDNSDDKANNSLNGYLAGSFTVPVSGGGWDFSFIRTCNYFLANYNKANESVTTKNIYVGETLFFRAMTFWNLVKTFGDVPYINKYIVDTSKSVLYSSRMPHKQVMDSVLKDLNFAVANIPVTTSDGRLNKYDALALLARVCLWEGTYRKYFGVGDEAAYLQTASAAAEQLMNSGKFSLYSTGDTKHDYYNLFIQYDLRSNPESIMCMYYAPTILMNGNDRSMGESGDGYSKNFVRSYLCTDGLPTSLSTLYQGDDSPDAEVMNRDPRMAQSIATRGFDFLNGDLITLPRIGSSVTSTGYQPIKGRSSRLADWNANASTLNFFIFRYAETLLIEAEAKAEMGQCTQNIVDLTINKLRDRVGMPHMIIANLVKDPKSNFPDLPILIGEIRRERRVELASDGFRFDDLHRWHAGTLINNPETILGMKLTPALRAQYPATQVGTIVVDPNNYIRIYPSITARTWNDKLYLSPIPTQEITLNPAIKQNPGW